MRALHGRDSPMRALAVVAVGLLVVGCSLPVSESVAQGVDPATLMPHSSVGLVVGVAYEYEMPPCGTAGPIDMDGSLWDAVGGEWSSPYWDSQPGIFQLLSPNEAEFRKADGTSKRFTRHDGPKVFRICS